MTAQLTLNLREGRHRADEGIARASAHQSEFVAKMRAEAIQIARSQGSVTADDVRARAAALGLEPKSPKAWGSIFRGPGWFKAGYRKSAVVTNNGHENPVWRFVGE